MISTNIEVGTKVRTPWLLNTGFGEFKGWQDKKRTIALIKYPLKTRLERIHRTNLIAVPEIHSKPNHINKVTDEGIIAKCNQHDMYLYNLDGDCNYWQMSNTGVRTVKCNHCRLMKLLKKDGSDTVTESSSPV